ncbi:MAG: hypothetical protein ACM3Y9_01200 [Ignavibacteria bacterium]
MALLRPLLLACAAGASFSAAASCGSAFCVLNTQWDTQGMTTDAGHMSVDLRYEFIRQDQLRRGDRNISAAEDGSDTTELDTVNRNFVASFDYGIDEHWGVMASLPAVKRAHSHIADPTGSATFESWDFARGGDARILGRYQFAGAAPTGRIGFQFGLKLPTGSWRVANAEGVVAERALQPGTGSTDLVFGGYYSFRPQYRDLGWFTQALYQRAIATRDGFRPGDQLSLTLGANYPVSDAVTLLFQLNGLIKRRDTGPNAEPDLSGGRFLYASPGVSIALGRNLQAYAFLQAPLLRDVNGVQLVARQAAVAGLSMRF